MKEMSAGFRLRLGPWRNSAWKRDRVLSASQYRLRITTINPDKPDCQAIGRSQAMDIAWARAREVKVAKLAKAEAAKPRAGSLEQRRPVPA